MWIHTLKKQWENSVRFIQYVVFFLIDDDMNGLVLRLFEKFNKGILKFVTETKPFVS